MKVKVRFFAAYREIAGTSQIELELQEGELVSDLRKMLRSEFHDLPDFGTEPNMWAVNTEYVQEDYTLHDGDVVALIPIVSGG